MPLALDVPSGSTIAKNVTWLDYEASMRTRGSSTVPRFNFYRGTLETVSPGPKHVKQVRRLASLVETTTEMWEIDTENLGSTTFKREDLACGFEPDCCFYMDALDAAEGLDDTDVERADPPPDLVLDIQSSGVPMPKLPLYAAMGVPEVWQIDGEGVLRIFVMEGESLNERGSSAAFYKIAAADLNTLLVFGRVASRVEWLKRVREWIFNL